MTREHAKELLPIITAFANGEDVQFRVSDTSNWQSREGPDFSGSPRLYRIAPKPRKVWVNIYPDDNDDCDIVANCFRSKEAADNAALNGRIACHEIELPPLP